MQSLGLYSTHAIDVIWHVPLFKSEPQPDDGTSHSGGGPSQCFQRGSTQGLEADVCVEKNGHDRSRNGRHAASHQSVCACQCQSDKRCENRRNDHDGGPSPMHAGPRRDADAFVQYGHGGTGAKRGRYKCNFTAGEYGTLCKSKRREFEYLAVMSFKNINSKLTLTGNSKILMTIISGTSTSSI